MIQRTCTWRYPCSLLALMAMIFIALGMPLVHPSLHDPSDHQCMSGAHAEAPQTHETSGEEKASECPICDFLATIQLYYIGSNPVITIEQSFDRVYLAKRADGAKAVQIPPKSRAPPLSPFA